MSTPASLDTASKCYCFNFQQFKSVVVYLLAKKAGLLALTPTQLDVASKCFCFNDGQFERITAYLLNQINGGGGTPSSLDTASKCFCFNESQFQRVVSYTLNQINGGTDTPASLNTASKCYCFNDDQFRSLVVYLLNQINGGTGTPASLDVASKCFCFNEAQFQRVSTYLLDQIGSVPPPWTPASEATLLGWWKADSLSLNDGDRVSSWLDSSGNGFTMTQTLAQRPTYKTNIKNGLPAVIFDPNFGQLMVSLMPSNTKPFTVAVVVMSPHFSTRQSTFCGSTTNGDLQFFAHNTGDAIESDSQNVALIAKPLLTVTDNNWYIVIMTYDSSGNWSIKRNAGIQSGTNNVALTGGGTTCIGAKSDTGDGLDGYIGEFIKFSSIVSIATISTYLNSKWAVF